jgi:hypothetical protein
MSVDTIASFYFLFRENLFCFEKKILKEDSFVETFTLDNWKGGLLKASNLKMKFTAPIFLYFQILLSVYLSMNLTNESVSPSLYLIYLLAL